MLLFEVALNRVLLYTKPAASNGKAESLAFEDSLMNCNFDHFFMLFKQ